MSEKTVLAVSGKGGVGKSTITALTVRILSERKSGSILAVDANPDSNLPELLGIQVQKTVGDVTEEMKRDIERGKIPPTITKKDLLEYQVIKVLRETPNFDLLVMGRGEGEGCYCMVNKLLTDIIDTLSKNYDITVMDEDAGLEHLSRRTDRDVDIMMIVTDPSSMGFRTARKIKEVAEEVHLQFRKTYLIGNRFPPEKEFMVREQARRIGVEFGGVVPLDEKVFEFNLEGKPITQLPSNSPAFGAVEEILKRIGLLPA